MYVHTAQSVKKCQEATNRILVSRIVIKDLIYSSVSTADLERHPWSPHNGFRGMTTSIGRLCLPAILLLARAGIVAPPVVVEFPPPSPQRASIASAGPPKLHGIHANRLYNNGRDTALIDPDQINCLGHASGVGSAVFPFNDVPLSETLAALGYRCSVADHRALSGAIAAGRDVMMVYLAMFEPSWRVAADRGLSFAALADRYGWTREAWRKPFLLYGPDGGSAPIDFHVITYNRATKQWEWVAEAKPKAPGGGYSIDSDSPAATDPDAYYPPQRVLQSLACTK